MNSNGNNNDNGHHLFHGFLSSDINKIGPIYFGYKVLKRGRRSNSPKGLKTNECRCDNYSNNNSTSSISWKLKYF